MIALRLGEIAEIVGGHLDGGADPAAVVTAPVSFDSRSVFPGGLFLALPGERVDGHDFVRAAMDAGAVAVLAERPVEVPCVVVPDGRAALAVLAAAVVRRLPDLTVVGVTGSSGKTSTKDLIAALLARRGRTVAPPGSFNNELGHPYTVLLADEATRFLVLEKSARGLGHIAYLSAIAPPRIGVVLNVGHAHIGEFGSQAAIAQAKGELVEALPPAERGGVAVLNVDDPAVAAMSSRTAARVVGVGESARADVRAEDVALDDLGRASFTLVAGAGAHRSPVRLRVTGEHQVGNALAAAAVALECGLPGAEVAETLGRTGAASRWRMEVTERADGVVVVNDAYNANPESMAAALKTLAGMGRRRRTWAVLGAMGELGEQSRQAHDAIGRLAVRLDIGTVLAVGDAARPLAQGAALEGSWNGEAAWVPDVDAALARLRSEVRPGDVVLVKASRAEGLERVAAGLLAEPTEPTEPTEPAAGSEPRSGR
ncbi:MAG: UDP-N-acetylmuramoyl-tripeptide--D-alanyl-D-alanine ligase [bacterium]